MEPRLESSIKWTPFPDEFLTQIKETFNDFFEDYDLNNKDFRIEGAIYPEEILLRVGLGGSNELKQDNFEASLTIGKEDEKPLELIHYLVDFLGQIWEKFLEDEDDTNEMPTKWSPNMWEKREIFFKYSSVNTELELQADQLLQQYEKKLVYENTSDDIDIFAEDTNTQTLN